MSARDDELTQRYREASAQQDAHPGAHVRDAVRAHAQMLAAAAAPLPVSPAPRQAAANQSRWRISALATVAVVGLTGLLLLQFQRGTPEEQEIAYGQRRAAPPARVQASVAPPAPATAPQIPSAALPAPTAPAPLQRSAHGEASPAARPMAPKPVAPAPGPTRPLVKTAPAPAIQETEAPPVPGRIGAVSGFPASPPSPGEPSSGTEAAPPAAAPSPPSAPSRAEMRERLAAQDASAARSMAPPPPAAAPAAVAETARSAAPVQARPAPQAAGSLRGGKAADHSSLAAPAPRADNGRNSASLPDGLREAARAGHTPQVESLIGQGVPIDAHDSAGRTALMLAAANGQAATVRKLLALGANPALMDHEGLSAAQQARRAGYSRIAELIEAGS